MPSLVVLNIDPSYITILFEGKKAETSFILYTLISDEFLFEKKYFWLFLSMVVNSDKFFIVQSHFNLI